MRCFPLGDMNKPKDPQGAEGWVPEVHMSCRDWHYYPDSVGPSREAPGQIPKSWTDFVLIHGPGTWILAYLAVSFSGKDDLAGIGINPLWDPGADSWCREGEFLMLPGEECHWASAESNQQMLSGTWEPCYWQCSDHGECWWDGTRRQLLLQSIASYSGKGGDLWRWSHFSCCFLIYAAGGQPFPCAPSLWNCCAFLSSWEKANAQNSHGIKHL